jgi:hypothetical protein
VIKLAEPDVLKVHPALPNSKPGLLTGWIIEVWPSGFVTTTATPPAGLAGAVAVTWVLLTTTTFVAAALPKATVAPLKKFVPVSVTVLPPLKGPVAGDIEVSVGGGL